MRITRNYWHRTRKLSYRAWVWTTGTGPPSRAETLQPFVGKSVMAGLVGFGVASAWTLAGFLIALAQGTQHQFVEEWVRMQAFFCLGIGMWLLFIARSGTLSNRARRITKDGCSPPRGIADQRWRAAIVLSVGITGTCVFITMGFNAQGVLLGFMWVMCVFICFMAGIVTLHAADLIVVIHNLQKVELKTHRYSPARTPELVALVSYFTFYSLLLTIGFAFACFGTLGGRWTGNPWIVELARWFWPAIYVPACSIALVYPHFVIRRLIQREKERALAPYQRDIDGLLAKYEQLKDEDVQRINTLAQVFDRFSSTPNYVFDFGIATRAVLPHLVNAVVFFAKPLLGQIS
jgi:hypothetical protein